MKLTLHHIQSLDYSRKAPMGTMARYCAEAYDWLVLERDALKRERDALGEIAGNLLRPAAEGSKGAATPMAMLPNDHHPGPRCYGATSF